MKVMGCADQVKVRLPYAMKTQLEERARSLGASTGGLLYKLILDYLDDAADNGPGWMALAKEAADQKRRARPKLTIPDLVKLIGPAKTAALTKAAGGARIPYLAAYANTLRRAAVVAEHRECGFRPPTLAQRHGLTVKYVRRLLQEAGFNWTTRRRRYWSKREGMVVGGSSSAARPGRDAMRVVPLR